MVSNLKNKKFLRILGIVLSAILSVGLINELVSDREVVPSYTPAGFVELAEKADAISENLVFGDEIGSGKMYISNTYSSNSSGRLFSKPKVCTAGSLESASQPEQTTGISCLKGSKRIFGTNEDLDEIVNSPKLEEWQKTATTIKQEDWARRNFEAGNGATFSYRNSEGLYLDIILDKDYKTFCGDKIYCSGASIGKSKLYVEIRVYNRYQNF